MKNLIICIIATLFSLGLYGQKPERDTSLYKIYEDVRKTSYIFNIDTSTVIFKRLKRYKGDIIVLANDAVIDTISFNLSSFIPDMKNNRLLWFEYKNNKEEIYFFDFKTLSFKYQIILPDNVYKGLINGKLFTVEEEKEPEEKKDNIIEDEIASGGIKNENQLIKMILSYDTINATETVVINIDKYTIDKFEDIEEYTVSPSSKKILLQVGIYESGDYSNRRYLVYDLKTNKIIKKNYNTYLNISKPIFLTNMFYDQKNYFFGKDYSYYYQTKNMLVFNENFNITDTVLSRQTSNKGFIYKNNMIKGFYFNSFIYKNERRKDVIIPSIMNYGFEKLLSNIFYDININKEDLTNYDINELLILKNMFFAKHNYEFESDYYQAYFNLYRFYNSEEKRKTRTKNINHLLTKQDKLNLKLIKSAIESQLGVD